LLIEGWRLPGALYTTVITLSTVGFNEVHSMFGPGEAGPRVG